MLQYILIIEDDASLRMALVDLLTAEAYTVSEAADGGAGLALAVVDQSKRLEVAG